MSSWRVRCAVATSNGNGGAQLMRSYNWLMDTAMPMLPHSAFKVLAVVHRQTWGWTDGNGGRKWRDIISHSQFVRKTGLNKNTVTSAVQQLLDFGLIDRERVGTAQFGKPIYAYWCVVMTPWLCPLSQNLGHVYPKKWDYFSGIVPKFGDTTQVVNESSNKRVGESLPADAGRDAGASFSPTGVDVCLSYFREFSNSTGMKFSDRNANVLALAYQDKPGMVRAWARHVISRYDVGQIRDPAGYLYRVLQDGEPCDWCVICGRERRKERNCAGCGGPVCYEHIRYARDENDPRVWCEDCAAEVEK